jgi:hypothetical protein
MHDRMMDCLKDVENLNTGLCLVTAAKALIAAWNDEKGYLRHREDGRSRRDGNELGSVKEAAR